MFQAGNGDRDDVDNYIILLTDGESNERETDTVPEAIDARVAGAKIISIGIGTDVNELELRGKFQYWLSTESSTERLNTPAKVIYVVSFFLADVLSRYLWILPLCWWVDIALNVPIDFFRYYVTTVR